MEGDDKGLYSTLYGKKVEGSFLEALFEWEQAQFKQIMGYAMDPNDTTEVNNENLEKDQS